ncbi:MAG: hypothetical protein GY700_04185 [Propionibacteriaceae bacterium]|nr:hypothetical protein [Propionibacteriaceae bacterium]
MPEAAFAALIGVGISLLNRYGLPRLDGFWLENCAKKPEEDDDDDDSQSGAKRRRMSPPSSESADEMGVAYTSSVNQEMTHSSVHFADVHS